jgi:polyisoprenoid-binding protein YceI
MIIRAVCALFALTPLAFPAEYRLAPAEDTHFTLEVHKTGLMSGKKHVFVFERYKGKLVYEEGKPEEASVTLSIEAGSAKCQDEWVSAGQLADIEKYAFEDMMVVKEYPRIVFESASVAPAGEGAFDVNGTLTIRDRSEPAVVRVTLKSDGDRLRFSGRAQVNLKDYRIKPRKAFLGVIGTKNEMDVSFDLIAAPGG